KPLELRTDAPSLAGPGGSFKIVTSWGASGDLEAFGIDDAKGGQSARVSGKGRASIDLLAGGGPTLDSLMRHAHLQPLRETGARPVEAPSPSAAPVPPAPVHPTPNWREDPVGFARPHLPWVGGGAAIGFLLAAIFGMMRRRPRIFEDED